MIKRTTYGMGYNTGGKHKTKEFGKRLRMYQVWRDMLKRCYAKDSHTKDPTYIGCTVADEWHNYQNFADWYYSQEFKGKGYEMDKDILVKGNKIYSPENCCLVPREINMLFVSRKRLRGQYPQGVHWDKRKLKYRTQMNLNGIGSHLGLFDCVDEAHQAYKQAKESHVKEMAELWFGNIEPRVYEALMDWKLES